MKTNILLLLAAVFLCPGLNAQFKYPNVENFGTATEKTLGYPNTSEGTQLIPVGIDLWEGDEVNTIYYGQVPAGSSDKPVLVFVHGYASNAQVWFKGDDNMYWDAYRDGYRTAFVSLTPNRHMWTNGNMLANMLPKIKSHYGVSKVMLVGWSKGSVDIDAAMVHFGANKNVSQAFTLSGPHFGTGIAELANSILLSLVNVIFLQNNDATLALKRGYMNYFRSITDGNANNTVKYTTLGAWGNGPLNRLSIPQGYLYLAGGSKSSGGNDGVVPYSSTRRPGGTELFGGQRKEYLLFVPYYTGPSETNLDHFEVTRGGKVWRHIKSSINSSSYSARMEVPLAYNPNANVSSNMQIISGRDAAEFSIEKNSGSVSILIASQTPDAYLVNSEDRKIDFKRSTSERIAPGVYQTAFTFENANTGKYSIVAEGDIAAVVVPEGGTELTLNTGLSDTKLVYQSGETINLSASLSDTEVKSVSITGTMIRSTDLELNKVEEQPYFIEFVKNGDKYEAKINDDLPAGIYDITVTADHDNFRKNVMSSIAVTGLVNQEISNTSLALESIHPNPAVDQVKIAFNLSSDSGEINIYNLYGQKVKTFEVSSDMMSKSVLWNISKENIKKGMYIIQLSSGKDKVSERLIIE